MKKIVSMLVVFCMAFSLLSTISFAAEPGSASTALGTFITKTETDKSEEIAKLISDGGENGTTLDAIIGILGTKGVDYVERTGISPTVNTLDIGCYFLSIPNAANPGGKKKLWSIDPWLLRGATVIHQ